MNIILGRSKEEKMKFADRLINGIDEKQNPSIVGLDPRIERIPHFIKEEALEKFGDTPKAVAESYINFNKAIIENIYDIVVAVKPQIAFYERYGTEGIKAFVETVNYAKSKGLIVIEDAKRNDIGSTAQAYSEGHIGKVQLCSGNMVQMFDVDAITINPYLGSDSIKPFIKNIIDYGKGGFILVKTSNPSSKELQDRKLKNSKTIFELIGEYVTEWGKGTIGERGYQSLGAVVGATFPKQAQRLRKIMDRAIFLSPGYGAQGAQGKDILPLFNEDGYGAIINSSRAIIFAYEDSETHSEEEFSEASREAAIDMKKEIGKFLKESDIYPW